MNFMDITPLEEPNWPKYNFSSDSPNHSIDTLNQTDTGWSDCVTQSFDLMPPDSVFTFSELPNIEPNAPESEHSPRSNRRRHLLSTALEAQASSPDTPALSIELLQSGNGQEVHFIPSICGPGTACPIALSGPYLEDCASVPCITKKTPQQPDSYNSSLSPCGPCPKTASSCMHTSQWEEPKPKSPRESQRERRESVDSKPNAKKLHLLVERRYRDNMNNSIAELHTALTKAKNFEDEASEAQNHSQSKGNQRRSSVRKGSVIQSAAVYVQQTEVEMRHMAEEIEVLKSRNSQLQGLVNCGDCVLMKQLVEYIL